MNLVRTRECGGCTVCCKDLPIDTTELRKTSGVLCQHCRADTGCNIYDSRPQVCRGWYCAWRMLPNLPDDWRPDRSGVMVSLMQESDICDGEVPLPYQTKVMLEFLILSENAIERFRFAEVIGGIVDGETPIFLAICGPTGYQHAKIFINDAIKSAVANRDRDGAMAVLREALEVLSRHEFELLPPLK